MPHQSLTTTQAFSLAAAAGYTAITAVVMLLSGCQPALTARSEALPVTRIDHPALQEISGIAASTRRHGLLWMINDSGNSNQLHAVSAADGQLLASIGVQGVSNVDWEDLAAFELHGEHWLLIADVGDNNARRRYGHLYLLQEPELEHAATTATTNDSVAIHAETVFSYPDGARDVEAVAVDTARGEILLVSKRDDPPRVYLLPLQLQTTNTPLLAQRIADVSELLPASAADHLRFGRYAPYVAQPTALDIHVPKDSEQAVSAVLLTYKNAYRFQRQPDADWRTAWHQPTVLTVPPMLQSEALAFDRSGCSLWVTSEQLPAPLHRIDSGLCDRITVGQ